MNINVFENQLFGKIRNVNYENDIWLVARDVCEVLQYSNAREAAREFVKDSDKRTIPLQTSGGVQNILCINIQGVYDLCLRSRMPKAKEFQDWITHEVLMDIRKYGMYIADNPGAGDSAICNNEAFVPEYWTDEKLQETFKKYEQDSLIDRAEISYLKRELNKNRDLVEKLEKMNSSLRKSYSIYRNVNSTFTTENIKEAQYQDIISNQYPVRVAIDNFFVASDAIGFGNRYDLFMKFLVDCEICVYVENMNLITPTRLSVDKGWFDYAKEFNGVMYFNMTKFAITDFARYVNENKVIENMTKMCAK